MLCHPDMLQQTTANHSNSGGVGKEEPVFSHYQEHSPRSQKLFLRSKEWVLSCFSDKMDKKSKVRIFEEIAAIKKGQKKVETSFLSKLHPSVLFWLKCKEEGELPQTLGEWEMCRRSFVDFSLPPPPPPSCVGPQQKLIIVMENQPYGGYVIDKSLYPLKKTDPKVVLLDHMKNPRDKVDHSSALDGFLKISVRVEDLWHVDNSYPPFRSKFPTRYDEVVANVEEVFVKCSAIVHENLRLVVVGGGAEAMMMSLKLPEMTVKDDYHMHFCFDILQGDDEIMSVFGHIYMIPLYYNLTKYFVSKMNMDKFDEKKADKTFRTLDELEDGLRAFLLNSSSSE